MVPRKTSPTVIVRWGFNKGYFMTGITRFIKWEDIQQRNEFYLPRGVVSKKDIGERRMRISMVLCSSEAAFRVKTCIFCILFVYFVFFGSMFFCIRIQNGSVQR